MSKRSDEIAEILRDRIRQGEYRPRVRIPSQIALSKEFKASSDTVAQAEANLRESGYLWTLPHKGSYARPRDDWRETATENSNRPGASRAG